MNTAWSRASAWRSTSLSVLIGVEGGQTAGPNSVIADNLPRPVPAVLPLLALALPARDQDRDRLRQLLTPPDQRQRPQGWGMGEDEQRRDRLRTLPDAALEQQAGQRRPGLADPRVPGREGLEQPEQVQPGLVPLLARGPPDHAEEPLESVLDLTRGHVDVGHPALRLGIIGVVLGVL